MPKKLAGVIPMTVTACPSIFRLRPTASLAPPNSRFQKASLITVPGEPQPGRSSADPSSLPRLACKPKVSKKRPLTMIPSAGRISPPPARLKRRTLHAPILE